MQFPSRFTACAIVFVAVASFTRAFVIPVDCLARFIRKTWPVRYAGGEFMGTGFFSELFMHVGQWGTHIDPPAHFAKGLRTVDQIDPKEMILPMALIDVHEDVDRNPDYTLSLGRVKKWEADHGHFPAGAFVAMRTDWSKRWPDANKMANKDATGGAHYLGWSLPALVIAILP